MNLLTRLLNAPTDERSGVVEIMPSWGNLTERAYGSSRQAYLISSTVHAAINARQRVFSEVDIVFRRKSNGDIIRNHPALEIIRNPWPGGTTTELLKRMELDASLSGNAFVYRPEPNLLQILDPQKVEVSTDGREKVGYLYWPGGINNGQPKPLLLDEVAHWPPLPHPGKQFMGASWVEVVATELKTDIKMIRHQEKFYDNAATPNLYVKVKGSMRDESRKKLREELDSRYRGFMNAWRTIVMDNDADLKVVGADFQQMDYVNTQMSTEARIAAAAGVPPIILHLKAGLDAATYSNYAMAMRAFADHLIRPNWNSVVAALAQIVRIPQGLELWYDDHNVSALRQDKNDEAKILQTQVSAITMAVRDGFEPDAAVEAIATNEIASLKGKHSGNLSVQLQPADPDAQPDSQDDEAARRLGRRLMHTLGLHHPDQETPNGD